jgi:hypothetical protein
MIKNKHLLSVEELQSLETFILLNPTVSQEVMDKYCRNRKFVVVIENGDFIVFK